MSNVILYTFNPNTTCNFNDMKRCLLDKRCQSKEIVFRVVMEPTDCGVKAYIKLTEITFETFI